TMLAKLIATAMSSSAAVSAWTKAISASMARGARAWSTASMANASLGALRGGDQLVPQRLELGLGLDDVGADRRGLRHQLLWIGGRQRDHLAALAGPYLALRHQEIQRPRKHLAADLVGGRHDGGLEVGRQAVEPALAQHRHAEDIGVAGLGDVFGRVL